MIFQCRSLVALLTAFVLAGCGGPAPDNPATADSPDSPRVDEAPGVTVDAAAQADLGIELESVRTANIGSESRGMATVVDASAFALAMADLDSLRSEAATAADNERRVRKLYEDDGNASRQTLDAARQRDSASGSKLVSAESRALLDWGAKLTNSGDAASARLRKDIASGAVTLFRAEFPDTLSDTGALRFGLLSSHHKAVALEYFDRSRAVAQFAAGDSVLLLLRASDAAQSRFRPGERVGVVATSIGAPRLLVPAKAAIAYQGRLWSYVVRAPNRFERIAIDGDATGTDGYAVLGRINEGEEVVVHGAALLLSLEKSASAEAGAE